MSQALSRTYIEITSVPPGGAPEEIRKEWIGLTLRVDHRNENQLADVVTGRKVNRLGGWAVRWDDAMAALALKSVQAMEWWIENVIPMDLIFTDDCCEVKTV